jgi:AraC-like DNA-binding protein
VKEDTMSGSRAAGPHRADTVAMHSRAVERVIGAMREHIDEAFSLDEMASLAIMSPFHFNRTFCEVTGIPPCQFLSTLRIEAAKRLLLTTELSVTDICFDVGYNSLGTFIRRFTGMVGVSPRRLRQTARLGRAVSAAHETDESEPCTVIGHLEAPADFQGRMFVGLFPGPLPQGRPLACAALGRAGSYALTIPPRDGSYHLFAAGIPDAAGARDYYLCESALRGGGQIITLRDGQVRGDGDLVLRPRLSTDPPILLSLPPAAGASDPPQREVGPSWPSLRASI